MHSVDDVDGQIIHRHRRTYGWEEIYPLQAGEQVKRIVVRYGMRYSESDDEMYRTEFFRHVGVDPASLKNLYDGPLESSIDWDG